MLDDPHALKLYIDGNCYRNPGGAGAIACVAHYPDSWDREDEIIFEEGFHETTNNRMELRACIGAFEYVAKQGGTLGVSRVIIVTDSMYVYENYKCTDQWNANDWKNSSGRPVENPDLWKQFMTARRKTRIRIDIHWSKGKKSPTLKLVDRTAKAAGKSPRKFDRGFRGGKVARSKLRGGSSSLYPANGQVEIIRVYRSGMIGKRDHKIIFDVFDTTAGTYVQKCRAYAYPSIAASLHRQHCYSVRFNRDPRYPLMEEIIEGLPCP